MRGQLRRKKQGLVAQKMMVVDWKINHLTSSPLLNNFWCASIRSYRGSCPPYNVRVGRAARALEISRLLLWRSSVQHTCFPSFLCCMTRSRHLSAPERHHSSQRDSCWIHLDFWIRTVTRRTFAFRHAPLLRSAAQWSLFRASKSALFFYFCLTRTEQS